MLGVLNIQNGRNAGMWAGVRAGSGAYMEELVTGADMLGWADGDVSCTKH
jgi:hypothetical protein